jgi:glyceraldehyde 3-phosphate dehydrogenase
MTINIAISGFGRIGRLVLRALYESKRTDIKIVAINCSRGDIKSHAHLIKYDTAHGRFEGKVETTQDHIIINGDKIRYLNTKIPEELTWKDHKVDVVLECTGAFRGKSSSYFHIDQGAKKVLISAPGEKDVDATIVYGVNHNILKSTDLIVSNSSCTTNGLAPIAKVIQDQIGIESGLMNTIHSYTNDQSLLDNMHVDIRRARAAAASMIPSKTGAAASIGLVIPELMGKLDGISIRVPTTNVSLVDLTFTPSKKTTKEEVNKIMLEASQGALKDILVYNDEQIGRAHV